MPRRACLFDLDGTLLDSLDDLANACNHALTTLGRPTQPRNAFHHLVGQGLPYLIQHALGPGHEHLTPQATQLHLAHYAQHMGEHTRPYPGIHELLKTLSDASIAMAVVTNKPHDHAQPCVDLHFPDRPFAAVRGHKPNTAPKPDPQAVHDVLDELGIAASDAVFVGDTNVDIQTGQNAGLFTVGVAWGFRPDELQAAGADAIIDSPAELLAYL